MKLKFNILILIPWLFSLPNFGQEANSDSLAIDEGIRYGILDNGLKYYIKALEGSNESVKMNLFVKVGSRNEDYRDRNFAHTLEHIAFRGTKNFPEGLDSNSKILAPFGMAKNNIGGRTNKTYTKYYFDIPKSNLEAINVGLRWFRDIANGLDLSKGSVDRERGVLLQEHRGSDANREKFIATKALYHKLFPCNRDYKNFQEHMRAFPPLALQNFYEKWYQPELMGLSIVGNIKNTDSIEKEINQVLGGIQGSAEKLITPLCDETYFSSPKGFALIKTTEDSITNTLGDPVKAYLFFRGPKSMKNLNNQKGLREKIKSDLLAQILNERFKESQKQYATNFNITSTHTQKLGKSPNALQINITAAENELEKGFRKTMTIMNQMKTYGIHESELEMIKNEFLNRWPTSLEKGEKYWSNQIRKNFVDGEALPKDKLNYLRNYVKNLNVEELNLAARDLLSKEPEDIGFIVPEYYKGDLAEEEKLRKFIKDNLNRDVPQYELPEIPDSLLSKDECSSLKLKSYQSFHPKIKGANEYILENGLRVILKPSSVSSGEPKVFLHGFSKKGASSFPEADYYSVRYSPMIVRNAGIGELNKFGLKRYLDSTKSLKLGIVPYVGLHDSGIKAISSLNEFEELLQLVYLYFNRAREDKVAFEDWKINQLRDVELSNSAKNDFLDMIGEFAQDYSNLPYGLKRIKATKQVEYERAYELYNEIFGRGQDFNFIITGDFETSKIFPLVQKYLGNLTNTSREPGGISENTGTLKLEAGPLYKKADIPDLYQTDNAYYGFKFIKKDEEDYDWKEEIKVQALGAITNKKIYNLRAKDGLALYFFGVSGDINDVMGRYEISFRFSCEPKELPIIKKKTKQIISDIKGGRISATIFEEGMKNLYGRYSTQNLKSPHMVQSMLYRNSMYQEPIVDPAEVEAFVKSLTIDDIAEMAKSYYKNEFKYELLMQSDNI